MVHAVAAGRHRRQLDVLHRQAAVLEIQPQRVEIAVFTDDLDQLGAEQLAGAEDPDHLPLGEHCLDSRHPSTSLPSTNLGE